eukprot:s611_g31.t1
MNTVLKNKQSGDCYEILVGGFGAEGDYMLSINCTVANTTVVPVECGSRVSGSTVNLPNFRAFSAGEQLHQFCPNRTGVAQVSTCNSGYTTRLKVNGPDVDRDCISHCGLGSCRSGFDRFLNINFGTGNGEFLTFDFKAGECYDIAVGGFGRREGNYVLSIDCVDRKVIECGTSIAGSTVGLPTLSPLTVAGLQPFLFCPVNSGRASVPGECYEVSLTGTATAEGNYELSLSCRIPNATRMPVDCGSFVTGSTFGLPTLRGDVLGGQSHFIFCPNSAVTAEISTCGSNFRTALYINGTDIEYACVGRTCYSFSDCLGAETTLNFTAGECYDIVVGGISDWEEGDYKLSVECASTSASNVTCPTYLWDCAVLEEIRAFAHPITVWGSPAEAEGAFAGPESPLVNGSQVILANTPWISDEAVAKLLDGLQRQNIHLIVFQEIQNIRDITGWSLELTSCPNSVARQLQGGGFAEGPSSLQNPCCRGWLCSAVLCGSDRDTRYRSSCVQREELPPDTDGMYGTASIAAWTSPYEKGRITYYASSFSEHPSWRQLLASSVGLVCAGEVVVRTRNSSTTTITPVPVVCGSIVSGTIVPGDSLNDGFKKHRFCTPEETDGLGLGLGEVLFSTCGSEIATPLTVKGPNGRWQRNLGLQCGGAELKVSTLLSGTLDFWRIFHPW